MNAQVEREIVPRPERSTPIDKVNMSQLATVTGGHLNGGELAFYRNDFFIDYPGFRLDTAIESPLDEGKKPILTGKDDLLIPLSSARVIIEEDRGRAVFVRAVDAPDNQVDHQIVIISQGQVLLAASRKPIEEMQAIDDMELREAALLSLNDSRKASHNPPSA